MSNATLLTLDPSSLVTVTGGQDAGCPDAADIYAQRAMTGVVDGAIRVDNAVDAARRGDIGGMLGNTAGAIIDAASTAKGLLTPPDTPLTCSGS